MRDGGIPPGGRLWAFVPLASQHVEEGLLGLSSDLLHCDQTGLILSCGVRFGSQIECIEESYFLTLSDGGQLKCHIAIFERLRPS